MKPQKNTHEKGNGKPELPNATDADKWFAQASDKENDFRNLIVEEHRKRSSSIIDQIVQARYSPEPHFIALLTVLLNPEHGNEYETLKAQRDELLAACKFLISQIETLAYRAFAEEVPEWLEKCDAVNAGKRAIQKAEGNQ